MTNVAISSTKIRAKIRKMMAVIAPVWKKSKKGVLLEMNHPAKKVGELTNPMTPSVTVPLRRGKQQQHFLRMAISNKEG